MENSNTPRWLREKLELSHAMRAAPSAPDEEQADLVPAAEIVGIYIAYATVCGVHARVRASERVSERACVLAPDFSHADSRRAPGDALLRQPAIHPPLTSLHAARWFVLFFPGMK